VVPLGGIRPVLEPGFLNRGLELRLTLAASGLKPNDQIWDVMRHLVTIQREICVDPTFTGESSFRPSNAAHLTALSMDYLKRLGLTCLIDFWL
jgi:hypothetical protein